MKRKLKLVPLAAVAAAVLGGSVLTAAPAEAASPPPSVVMLQRCNPGSYERPSLGTWYPFNYDSYYACHYTKVVKRLRQDWRGDLFAEITITRTPYTVQKRRMNCPSPFQIVC